MASSGPNSPGTEADDATIGTKTWLDISRVVSSDDSYTSYSGFPDATAFSHYLKCTNFGFSIPSGTIDGILVEIERRGTNTSTNKCYDNSIKLIKGGAYVGSDKAATSTAYPTTDTYASYGSSSDLWGTTWTFSEINDSNFGVGLSVKTTCDGKNGVGPLVDHIRITVYYTESSGTPRSQAMTLG